MYNYRNHAKTATHQTEAKTAFGGWCQRNGNQKIGKNI